MTQTPTTTTPRTRRPADNPAPRGRAPVAFPKKTRPQPEADAKLPPIPRHPQKFERGELPIFLLGIIREYGPQLRATLAKAAFGKAVDPYRRRANGVLDRLVAAGYLVMKGTDRSHTYHLTPEGRAELKHAAPPPKKKKE